MTTETAPAHDAPQAEHYRGVWLTVLLSLLLGFASISTDLYLPALPSMAASLGASQGTLELTVSGYLLGFSLGQLFWGPVSDRYGRKVPLLAGVAIFAVGAAGCALSTDAFQMIGSCRLSAPARRWSSAAPWSATSSRARKPPGCSRRS